MPTYQVTASNRNVWKTLRVAADTKDTAVALFREFLAGPDHQATELREHESSAESNEGASDARADFVYRFSDDQVEEIVDDSATEEVEEFDWGENPSL